MSKDRRSLPGTVLPACVGCSIEVELKNDIVIRGILDDCDTAMNMILGRCQSWFSEGPRQGERLPDCQLTFVAARRVRYIRFERSELLVGLRAHWQQKYNSQRKRHMIVDRQKVKYRKVE